MRSKDIFLLFFADTEFRVPIKKLVMDSHFLLDMNSIEICFGYGETLLYRSKPEENGAGSESRGIMKLVIWINYAAYPTSTRKRPSGWVQVEQVARLSSGIHRASAMHPSSAPSNCVIALQSTGILRIGHLPKQIRRILMIVKAAPT
nr:hypothetical protein Iba_chr02aCG15400 [Ipomoea batatas]